MFSALSQVSTVGWLGLSVVAAIAVTLLGMITNAIMSDRGFGVIPNGVMMLIGIVAGALTRLAVFGTI